MKIRIYFNYCKNNSINLIYKDFNVLSFNINLENNDIYFFDNKKHEYKHFYLEVNSKKIINSIIFGGKEYNSLNFGGKILGNEDDFNEFLKTR